MPDDPNKLLKWELGNLLTDVALKASMGMGFVADARARDAADIIERMIEQALDDRLGPRAPI